ncbi:MAG: hypothetical protein ACKN9R_04130 [Candidatus Limnocylindrus sp.]
MIGNPKKAPERILRHIVLVISLLTISVLPASVQTVHAINSQLHIELSIVNPAGIHRTNGKVFRGDIVTVNARSQDETLTLDDLGIDCAIQIYGFGGGVSLRTALLPEGQCAFKFVVPSLRIDQRHVASGAINDWVGYWAVYEDCQYSLKIVLPGSIADLDGDTPNECVAYGQNAGRTLSFDYDGTGPEVGATQCDDCSKLLGWNPTDWDSDYEPFEFQETWNLHAPAWVDKCTFQINGEWTTGLKPGSNSNSSQAHKTNCAPQLRLPGVLPETLPGGNENVMGWDAEFIFQYEDAETQSSGTIHWFEYPSPKPSDGVVEANMPLVFPVDLGVARYAAIGAKWKPSFRVTYLNGSDVPAGTYCQLLLSVSDGHFTDWSINYGTDFHEATAPVDQNGICSFDIQVPYTEPGQDNQWAVFGMFPLNNPTQFFADVWSISSPGKPKISTLDYAAESVVVEAQPGEGAGLALELSITSIENREEILRQSAFGLRTITFALPDTPICTAREFSPTMFEKTQGGDLSGTNADCRLSAGSYRIVARMIDASGKITRKSKVFTLKRASAIIKPTISGVLQVGQNLRVVRGSWVGSPEPSFTYQWYACSKEIPHGRPTPHPACEVIEGATRVFIRVTKTLRRRYIAVFVTGKSGGTRPTSWLTSTIGEVP